MTWPLVVIICLLGGFVIGYVIGDALTIPHPYSPADIEKMLRKQFPNEWAAYQRGVEEGYSQGLRDGQEIPHEPT